MILAHLKAITTGLDMDEFVRVTELIDKVVLLYILKLAVPNTLSYKRGRRGGGGFIIKYNIGLCIIRFYGFSFR